MTRLTRSGPHPWWRTFTLRPVKAARPAVRQIAWLRRESIASGPQEAFELSFRYRNPVIVLADGYLGQMTGRVALPRTLRRPG